jgi:rod shape-determining protein MreD
MNNWTTTLRVALACAILIVLHYTLRPLLGWRASVDFLLVALLFGSVRMRPGHAAIYGLILGLVADSATTTGFGASALAMTTVGFTASWLKAVFFADHPALNAFFLFTGKWLFDVIFFLSGHRDAGSELLMQLVVWSPLAAAVTAVAGTVMLAVLRPIAELKSA